NNICSIIWAPKDAIVDHLRKSPTVQDELLATDGKGAWQFELFRAQGRKEEIALNGLDAQLAGQQPGLQIGQGEQVRAIRRRLDFCIGEQTTQLSESHRIGDADKGPGSLLDGSPIGKLAGLV